MAGKSKIQDRITCAKCDERKALRNYYTYGGDFKKITKYGNFPICKDCQKEGFNKVNKFEIDDVRKYIFDMCQMMNKPFLHIVIDGIYAIWKNDDKTDIYKEYFAAVSKGKYNTKEFVNGDLKYDKTLEYSYADRKIKPEEKNRWEPYKISDNTEMFSCQDMYDAIKKEYGIVDTTENSDNLEKLVILKNRERNTVTHGEAKDIKALQQAIKEIEGIMGISKQRAKIGTGANTFGEFVMDIELEDPYMGDKLTYKDVDKLVKIAEIVLISTGVAMGTGDKERVRNTILKEWDVE